MRKILLYPLSILSILLFFGLIVGISFLSDNQNAEAQMSGGITPAVHWWSDGTHLYPVISTMEIGSTTARITKGWFDDLDTTNITIGGVSSGDLDMGNHAILNASYVQSVYFHATGTAGIATSTFEGAFATSYFNIYESGNIVVGGGADFTVDGGYIFTEALYGTANNDLAIGVDSNIYLTIQETTGYLGVASSTPYVMLGVEGDIVADGNATTSGSLYVNKLGVIGIATSSFAHYVTGIYPIQLNQLATKEYVDTAGGDIVSYFLSDQATGVAAPLTNTTLMEDKDTGEGSSTLASTSMASGDNQVLWRFISSSTVPFNNIAAGTYTGHLHYQRTGGNRTLVPYFEIWASSTDETQTLIALSEKGDPIGDTASTNNIHANRATDYELTAGDNIIMILYADVGAGGAPTDITITMEGTEDSRLDIVAPGNVFSDFFVRRDGSKTLTENWAVGGYNITGISTASTSNLIVDATTTSNTLNIGSGNLYISENGRLGISTTTPGGDAKVGIEGDLYVSGDILNIKKHPTFDATSYTWSSTTATSTTKEIPMPFNGSTTDILCTVTGASSANVVTFDVNKNGTTILSTKVTIDASETTSLTAAIPHVIDATGYFVKGDKLSLDVDTSGTGTLGGICVLTVTVFSY